MRLLDGISDPVFMARIAAQRAERNRIIDRLAEQMGLDREEAEKSLWHFEHCETSEGQTLH